MIDADRVREATRQLRRVRGEWLRRPGVTAVDVGFKIKEKTGDIDTATVALRAHVERKKPVETLHDDEVFDADREEVDFPVDVIEAAYAPSQGGGAFVTPAQISSRDRLSRLSVLVGGVSVGSPRATGTLGAIVWDRTDGSVNLLSNWHVLVGSAVGSTGEPYYQATGEPYYQSIGEPYYQGLGEPYYQSVSAGAPIIQPGPADGGTPADVVAAVNRFRLNRDMDAALARLNGARTYSRDLAGLEPITGTVGGDEVVLGMLVAKSGRSTATTRGIVDGVSLTTTIRYRHGSQTFDDQIHIVPREDDFKRDWEISSPGDSGSVWVEEKTGRAVGLHFAGETDPAPASEHALANPMHKVVDELGFSFVPLLRRDRPEVPVAELAWLVACLRDPALCGALLHLVGGGPSASLVDALTAVVHRQQPDTRGDVPRIVRDLKTLLDAVIDSAQ